MKEELQNKLYEKYPKIFAEKDLPMSQTCMCWGINTENGWAWLIDHLCSSLQWMTDNPPTDKNGKMEVPQIVASQVKEKFGGLRFYVNGANKEQYAKISFAEALSYHICELCGSTKDIGHTSGWVTTMCKECALKLEHPERWKQDKDD
jgi:hypothetical protein